MSSQKWRIFWSWMDFLKTLPSTLLSLKLYYLSRMNSNDSQPKCIPCCLLMNSFPFWFIASSNIIYLTRNRYNSTKSIPFISNWFHCIEREEDYFSFLDQILLLLNEKEFEESIIHLLISLKVSNVILSYLPDIMAHPFSKPISRRYLVDLLCEVCQKNSGMYLEILLELLKDKG
jgi:hypothetical protein